ncbi:1,4-alpha-glucan-branching enzyme [Galdieria sulphuraria]|nr:1,4-alpha-glucan-branching enzyme [Galdieria sulphuraria]
MKNKEKPCELKVVKDDPSLEPFCGDLLLRNKRYRKLKSEIEMKEGGLDQFSYGYSKFGLHRCKGGLEFREWLPGAKDLYLFGDFNDWKEPGYPLQRDSFGHFYGFIPDNADGSPAIAHASRIKLRVLTFDGQWLIRNPAWATFLIQNPTSFVYDAVFWSPPEEWRYSWRYSTHATVPKSLRIYECHIGIATNEPKVGSFVEFAQKLIPKIKGLGYTAIQLMAVMEHSYYASFGYHVTNFFAVSSRYGTPEDLKFLVDEAHNWGLYVLMDIVHSHASSNSNDGLNLLDGTDYQYFHHGERGNHPEWGSRLFDYSKWEVLRFLLSNARWFLEEYHFDGFRFDGVTSMLYNHHGIGVSFSGDYKEYFGFQVDMDACVYLMLMNDILHHLYPESFLSIAEDVSGMPTLCRPVEEGGIGFDYRLGMGIPDMWVDLVTNFRDEDWDMGRIVYGLTNRRWNEYTVGYVESHDQALVGDKTLAFRLMDAEMYSNMSIFVSPTDCIIRGIALHKMIRLITYALGGEAYLNFMGNEFGHPEWIDFPRAGNNFSYQYARRQWNLVEDGTLRYQHLNAFDCEMHALESQHAFCRSNLHQWITVHHNQDKVIAFEKGDGLLFVFNFHPVKSFSDYSIGVLWPGKYVLQLDSDRLSLGGFDRIDQHVEHFTHPLKQHGRPHSLQLYLPNRSCQVYYCADLE